MSDGNLTNSSRYLIAHR